MNAFDPIAFAHKLEASGLKRVQAETLASELREAMLEHVTREQLKAELNSLLIRQTGAVAALLALAVTLSNLF